MNIEVTGRNNTVSEKVKNYAEQKVGKVGRFFDRITSARVVLETDASVHRAEIVLMAGGGTTIVGESNDSQTLYAAIDSATDKLERQVKKHKEKLVERNRKPSR